MKKALSLFLALIMLAGMMPQYSVLVHAEEVPMYLEVAPEDYLTISRDSTEKLACGPCMVSYGNGNFAVAYLADDINTVETESSTTIVCRLGLFDLADPEQGTFFDIATAGQTIGDVTIGSKAPYEPNLLALDNNTLLVLFNIRDTSGNYVYYSASFDTKTGAVTSYQPLSLNGKSWTPANIAEAYNAMGTGSISTAGPTSSMVFTSQILRYGGYFYGYCGGVCNGFSGMLVRSTDGIHWETVMAPEAASEMKGIIECGFRIMDDMIYFCMRDISSGVYHCSYRFSTQEQLTKLQKLSNLTTSKPTTFVQDDQLYLIVNKATGDDNTVGRRNTALIYRVDPETCKLTQVKQVFCGDGCAYHTVAQYNGTNYWCFHTDARRINPYTQGRSNLAFLKIPAFAEPSTPENSGAFDFANYTRAKGCVALSTNTWQSNAVNYHYQIPLSDFSDCDKVTITANPSQKAYIAFFTEKMTSDGAIAYAEGWTTALVMEPGTTQTLTIPADAQYLYILETNAAGNSLLPSQVEFHPVHNHNYIPTTTLPTCTQQGYTTYTCACGDSYVDDYVKSGGHTFSNGVCTDCGYTFAGKTVSILGDSISTFTGISNNTSYNSTISRNEIYYTAGRLDVYLSDTWWQQTIDALGLKLCVNNSWSGSTVFYPRKGETSVGYGDRCVQLHNDRTGQEPDVIFIFLGTNDFSYYQDTLGTADIDYASLIRDEGDGTFAYATPTTSCEAYAIMLHKIAVRYPDAEVYCANLLARRSPDKVDSYADVGQPTQFNAELAEIITHFNCNLVDFENCGIAKEAAVFDTYIGDQRVHPNKLGMDKMTEAVVTAMLGKKAEICTVTNTLSEVVNDNPAASALVGGCYTANLSATAGGQSMTVTVTMNGMDVTADCYADGKVTISNVTGNIAITATAQREPMNFRWDFRNGGLLSTGDSGHHYQRRV